MRKFGRAQWKEEPITTAAAAIAPVLSVVTAGLGLANAMRGPKSVDMPAMPTIPTITSVKTPGAKEVAKLETPTVMPVADSKLTQDAKRRAVMAASARDGRASTIMSSDSDGTKFGG